MAHRPHTPLHLLRMLPQRHMPVPRPHMYPRQHQQLHLPQATMGIALRLLVYTPPKHQHRTQHQHRGALEHQRLEPTAPQHLLSAKPQPRTRTTADLMARRMHLVWVPSSKLHLADTHTEERKNWLLDFRIPGLNIKFKDNSEWFGGKFDDQQVKLVAVLEGASGRDNHTATVQFRDRDETGGVPIEILQPVYPKGQEYRGSRAVLLQDSTEVGRQGQAAKKGEIVVLSTYGDKEWLCERTQDQQTNEDIEMKEMSLCLWSELDM